MIQRWISALLVLVLLCCLLPAGAEETVKEKSLPLYLLSIDQKDEIRVLFPDGNEDIPYVTAEEMCRLLNLFWQNADGQKGYKVTLQDLSPDALLVRENGADAHIDFENGVISFGQYDRFVSNAVAVNMLDIVTFGGAADEKGGTKDVSLILHDNNFECPGNSTEVHLRDYNIPSPVVNGVGCLPLQTFSDLFVAAVGAVLCYNGEIVVLASGGVFDDPKAQQSDKEPENAVDKLNELGKLYYSVPNRERSEALASFNFDELCLALDFHYGLRKEHDIDNFREFFTRSGLITKLLDPDAKTACDALSNLCINYLADGHSAVDKCSPYMKYQEVLMDIGKMTEGMQNKAVDMLIYQIMRIAAFPNDVPGYEEIGNTAYVTFDLFSMDLNKDYYTANPEEKYKSDTQDAVGLLVYATQQIKRKNSPIENVVIDLSNNGGGYVDVAMCLCSWALGSGTINVQNVHTGGKSVTKYTFDANLNHEFGDDGDSVSEKNVFCLISPTSFSCGNLVPAAFKASGKVTLLGKASTGGTCTVQILSTADGTLFNVSSRMRINNVNNGIFYDVDEGVEPHYYLPKPSMFYDRKKLTDYINGLMW